MKNRIERVVGLTRTKAGGKTGRRGDAVDRILFQQEGGRVHVIPSICASPSGGVGRGRRKAALLVHGSDDRSLATVGPALSTTKPFFLTRKLKNNKAVDCFFFVPYRLWMRGGGTAVCRRVFVCTGGTLIGGASFAERGLFVVRFFRCVGFKGFVLVWDFRFLNHHGVLVCRRFMCVCTVCESE